MEEQRNGDEPTPEETVDDGALTPEDDAARAEDASPSEDEGLSGLEDFEVVDQAADTGEGEGGDAAQEPDAGEDADTDDIGAGQPASDEPEADEEPAAADAADEEDEAKGGLSALLSINFLSNDVLRIAAVVATVVGIILAGVGAWKLLDSEPIVPEGIEPGVEDAPGSADDWAAYDSGSAMSSDTADLGASPASDATVASGVEVDPPALAPEPVLEPEGAALAAPVPEISPAEPSIAAEPPSPPEPEPVSSQPEPWEVWVSPATPSPVSADAQRLEPVPALVPEASAYEQLMMSRRAAGAGFDASDLSAQARAALAQTFQDADMEFARFLVEDAADIPTFLGEREWRALRDSPAYARTLFTIYDHALSVEDKLVLYSAYTRAQPAPESAPAALTRIAIATPALDNVRRTLWSERGADVQLFVGIAQ